MRIFIVFFLTFVFAFQVYSQNATITGKIKFEGKVPKRRPISMKADKQCDAMHKGQPVLSEDIVVGEDGGLQWVFVYVKEGVKGNYKPPKDPVVLDQKGCWYYPHVFGVMVGQKLEILNSDPLLHNIHATPKKNRPFNFGQPIKGMKNTVKFKNVEVMVPFKCDVHPWMSAYAGVLDHPFFAVTNERGEFTIKDLPPGTYTIEAWHERLGTQTQTVTVAAGETKTIEFTFQRKRRR